MSHPWTAQAKATYLQHLRDLKAFDADLIPILRDAAQEAARIVNGMVVETFSDQVRSALYRQVQAALAQSQASMWASITPRLQAALEATSMTAAEGTALIDSLLAQEFALASLGDSFMASARASIETVRSRLINAIDLSPKVYKTQALTKGWIDRAVNRGLLLRKSAAEIARDVSSLILPNTPGGVSYAARRLARTELNNAFHTTTIRTAASQPWTEGMKWNLSSSHPRADPCDDFAHEDSDGLGEGVFKPNNVPNKPHPQCLCYLTIVTVEPDEFVDSFIAGKYDTWLKSQGL